MEYYDFTADMRDNKGKGHARTLRRQGLIPAILYGPATAPTPLSVSAAGLKKLLIQKETGQLFVNLQINNQPGGPKAAILREIQRDPRSRKLIHADFYHLDVNRKIQVMVPVVTTGKSKGVELGGMLQIIRRELEVSCLPAHIPDVITIDVTDLDIGDVVHVKAINAGENVEIIHDVNFTVVTVLGVRKDAADQDETAQEGEADGKAAG